MLHKPNLLVIGASGGVANAVLHHLRGYRGLFGQLVLLDRNSKVTKDPYIDHKTLDYRFIKHEIELPKKKQQFIGILKRHRIGIVLDITDADTLPLLEVIDGLGISYVNTAMNSEELTVTDLLFDVYPRKAEFKGAPHVLCTGMNPGVVNMWVRYGIEKFGLPKELVHFEYDTSVVAKGWHPMMTWSLKEYIVESLRDPTGVALGRGKVEALAPNAQHYPVEMRPILEPIMPLAKYPRGLTVLHEENLSVSYKYDIPSKFIYAVNQKTMAYVSGLLKKNGVVRREDLEQCDNTDEPLDGADNIGVCLEYPDKRVYYYNSEPNKAFIGTSATYTQVAIGIFSALFTLVYDRLKPQAYFVEDLYDTHYRYFLFDNLRVQEYVFKKRGKRKLALESYNPMVRIKRTDRFEHFYII